MLKEMPGLPDGWNCVGWQSRNVVDSSASKRLSRGRARPFKHEARASFCLFPSSC